LKPKRYWITEKEGVFTCNGKTYDSLQKCKEGIGQAMLGHTGTRFRDIAIYEIPTRPIHRRRFMKHNNLRLWQSPLSKKNKYVA